jgi:O-antigen/teichoic acid export membrane protein
MGRLVRNISANLVANTWATVLALVVTPVYVRLLGVESYGLIGFYTSWVAVLGILDTGISATAMRELAWRDARTETRQSVGSVVRTLEVGYWATIGVLALAMLLGATMLGASWFHAAQLSPAAIRRSLLLMVVSLAVQVPSGLYIGGLMGLQRQVECASLIAAFGTLRAGGAVFILMARPDIETFFTWQIVASLLQTSTIRWFLWAGIEGRHEARFSRSVLASVGAFATAMTLLTALSVVLTQGDKLILSRLVPLEDFGFYMLAWTVASGLSRVSTPLIQAFAPRFTELMSRGDRDEVSRQVRMASRLMSSLILPPAAVIALVAKPVLLLWTGEESIAANAAPLLAILVVGTALSASSYPALSLLYSQNRLRPVFIVNIAAVIVLLPVLVGSVRLLGMTGPAVCWVVYGATVYVAYHWAGLDGLTMKGRIAAALQDVLVPAVMSVMVAAVTAYYASRSTGPAAMAQVLAAGLISGWVAAFLLNEDARARVRAAWRWHTIPAR